MMTLPYSISFKLCLLMVLELSFTIVTCLQYSGLYYKLMTIINDNSSITNKLEITLIDGARVVIYDRHMFTVQWLVL
jgi:hypothetical protein